MTGPGRGRYQRPPREECDVDEYPIDLGADAARPDELIVLAHCVWWRRRRAVHFSLELQVHDAQGVRRVCRVDTSDGELHRHDYRPDGSERRRQSLLVLPPGGHDEVDREYQSSLDKLIDEAVWRVEAWRRL